jgi:hypothetical protein
MAQAVYCRDDAGEVTIMPDQALLTGEAFAAANAHRVLPVLNDTVK